MKSYILEAANNSAEYNIAAKTVGLRNGILVFYNEYGIIIATFPADKYVMYQELKSKE